MFKNYIQKRFKNLQKTFILEDIAFLILVPLIYLVNPLAGLVGGGVYLIYTHYITLHLGISHSISDSIRKTPTGFFLFGVGLMSCDWILASQSQNDYLAICFLMASFAILMTVFTRWFDKRGSHDKIHLSVYGFILLNLVGCLLKLLNYVK